VVLLLYTILEVYTKYGMVSLSVSFKKLFILSCIAWTF